MKGSYNDEFSSVCLHQSSQKASMFACCGSLLSARGEICARNLALFSSDAFSTPLRPQCAEMCSRPFDALTLAEAVYPSRFVQYIPGHMVGSRTPALPSVRLFHIWQISFLCATCYFACAVLQQRGGGGEGGRDAIAGENT